VAVVHEATILERLTEIEKEKKKKRQQRPVMAIADETCMNR